MNGIRIKMFSPFLFIFLLFCCSKQENTCCLIKTTDQNEIVGQLDRLIRKNKNFLELTFNQKNKCDAQDWLRRYFSGTKSRVLDQVSCNITGIFEFENIHPNQGLELCVGIDEGLLIMSFDGEILGELKTEIPLHLERKEFVDIDSDGLKEIAIKELSVSNNESRIKIYKFMDKEYCVVFDRLFKESYWDMGVVHPILEQIWPIWRNDVHYLLIKDEGGFLCYNFVDNVYKVVDDSNLLQE